MKAFIYPTLPLQCHTITFNGSLTDTVLPIWSILITLMAETLEGTESIDTLSVPAHLALEGTALIYVCMNINTDRLRTHKAFLWFWIPINKPISKGKEIYLCRNSCFSWHQSWLVSNVLCYTARVQRYNFKCSLIYFPIKPKKSQNTVKFYV